MILELKICSGYCSCYEYFDTTGGQQASENLGMAMIYTLVTSAKEWLSDRFADDTSNGNAEAEEAAKDDVRMSFLPYNFPSNFFYMLF